LLIPRWLLLAGCALVLSVPPASAEDPPEEPKNKEPEIVVVGIRSVAKPGGASAIEVRPDSMSLSPVPALEEVLRELPLLYVRTNSRGEAEISARGSESRQVALLVDGVPITLAWDARADASIIPSAAIQELSYVRGVSSMLDGPNVLGGVIEIKSGHSLIQPQQSSYLVRTGVDHVGGTGGAARVTVPFLAAGGSWVIRAGAGVRDSPGQPLAKGVTERVETEKSLRLNTDSHITDGFMSLRYIADGGAWCALSGTSFSGERGIAAELGVPDGDARFWRYPHVSRTLAVLSAGTGDRKSPLGGYAGLEASLGFDNGRTDIDAYTSPTYEELDTFEDGKDRTLNMRLRGNQALGARADLRGAFTMAEVRHDEILPEGNARYRQRLWSLGAETDARLIERGSSVRSWRLSFGGAWDVAGTPQAGGKEPLGRITGWGGRVGTTVGLRNGATQLHAGLSHRSRFPALRELYSGALNRFAPNPDLKPERLATFEGGVTTRIRRGELQAVLFYNRLRDAVARIKLPAPDNRYMRINRDELTSVGLELFASQRWGRFSLTGNFTAQSVDLTDTQAGVTNRPENLPELFGGAAVRARLGRGFTGGVEALYNGEQFTIDPETGDDRRLDAGTRLDLELTRRWGPRLETTLAVDNVTDTAIYDLIGLPRPGRSVRLQFQFFGRG
jgi:iron complex outermembrane receptor protein